MKFPLMLRSTHNKIVKELRQELALALRNDLPHDPKTGQFYNPTKEKNHESL